MFHLEQLEFDAVLDLYDRCFRNLASSLNQALPDLYIDVQNAASMLFRLERHGIDVGDRWIEIADKAEQRIGDCLSAFTQSHWMMALAATRRDDAARRMLDAMRVFGLGAGAVAQVVGAIAVPVSKAVLVHRRGEYARAVDLMKPILDEMYRLDGSHAQQDVLEQLFLDSAVKANRGDDVRLILARVTASHPIPPERRIGYAQAARQIPQVLTRRFGTGMALGLMAKDVTLAADFAHATGAASPIAGCMRQIWTEAAASIGSKADHTEIVRLWEDAIGAKLDDGSTGLHWPKRTTRPK
jgi:hypothetical protein